VRFPTAIALVTTFSGFASAAGLSPEQAQRSGDLALALDCSVRGRIQFQVSNNGDSDTTVVP
jgi:hypothetical protein